MVKVDRLEYVVVDGRKADTPVVKEVQAIDVWFEESHCPVLLDTEFCNRARLIWSCQALVGTPDMAVIAIEDLDESGKNSIESRVQDFKDGVNIVKGLRYIKENAI